LYPMGSDSIFWFWVLNKWQKSAVFLGSILSRGTNSVLIIVIRSLILEPLIALGVKVLGVIKTVVATVVENIRRAVTLSKFIGVLIFPILNFFQREMSDRLTLAGRIPKRITL